MSAPVTSIGFVGLGHMGSLLAANLVNQGYRVLCFDQAGTAERLPPGGEVADSTEQLVRTANIVVLSLPSADATRSVCTSILDVPKAQRCTETVIDTSTIGVSAARDMAAQLTEVDVDYFDAPVSGGTVAARRRAITVMVSGPKISTAAQAVLDGLSDRVRHVGDVVGLAQALKIANNYLSATALIATSEAVAFGAAAGLDMATMVTTLNECSGRSAATEDKFPNHVLTGSYSAGFSNALMLKDLALYVDESAAYLPSQFAHTVLQIWDTFLQAEPNVDFTRIYPFIAGRLLTAAID
jgi:3-hydroxyisobutyrate dehydrogenase